MADLSTRLELLERTVAALMQGRKPRRDETLTPTYLTVAPSGQVDAQFSGSVVLNEGPSAPGPPAGTFTNAVAWQDAGGLKNELIEGWAAGGIHHLALLTKPDANDYAQISFDSQAAGPAGGSAITLFVADSSGNVIQPLLLASDGRSGFLRLLADQQLQLNFGSTGTIISGGTTTINHGLPRTPQAVIVTNAWADATSSVWWTVFNVTATQFSAANKGTTSGSFYWLAIG